MMEVVRRVLVRTSQATAGVRLRGEPRINHLDLGPNPGRIPKGSYPALQDNRDLIRSQILHS
jgi:hypothetical protein